MNLASLTLIYFSPTSTTKTIVQAIADGFGIQQKIILDLTDLNQREAAGYRMTTDLAIIGVPVYGTRIPKILYRFFTTLHGNQAFAVPIVVYGNVDSGLALDELVYLLNTRGLRVIAQGNFIGEHSFSTPEAPLAVNRPDQNDIQIARDFGQQIRAKMLTIDRSDINTAVIKQTGASYALGMLLNTSHVILPQAGGKMALKKPVVDAQRCTRCNACVKRCPTLAIDQTSLTTTMSRCIQCCACVRVCPTKTRTMPYRCRRLIQFLFQRSRAYKYPETYLVAHLNISSCTHSRYSGHYFGYKQA